MKDQRKHSFKKWEVTIIEIQDNDKTIYKVTRRLAEMEVAETKMYETKEEAKHQFERWLNE